MLVVPSRGHGAEWMWYNLGRPEQRKEQRRAEQIVWKQHETSQGSWKDQSGESVCRGLASCIAS